jgi:hypothetical protein
MEEEDRSDVGSDDIASQTVVQNLELLTTTLQSYFRSEIAIVCDDIEKQSAAVKIVLSAAKETAREMKDLKVLMTTMSERIDKLTEENRALRIPEANASASYTAAAASSIDTTSAAKAEMDGASNPAPAGEATEGYLPHTNSHALGACGCGNRPRATPAIDICHGHRARTSPWRHG